MQLLEFKTEDASSIVKWIKSEADLVQWAGPGFSWPFSVAQFIKHLQASSGESPTLFPFGFYAEEMLVGYCELANYLKRSNSAVISRVIISPEHRSKGLGRAMLTRLISFGFGDLDLNRIGLGVFDFNKRAIRCYESIGFVYEGTLRASAKVGDEYWNCRIMSILKNEWHKMYTNP